MSQILSAILILTNSILFSSMVHPMNMGILLLTQTLMVCLMTSFLSYSSWFSYILFLVFLGGMLVLFIYMTSIASNEMFKKSMYYVMFSMLALILVSCIMMMMEPYMFNIYPDTMELADNSTKTMMTPIYNAPTANITVFMVLYLLLTLIVIAYITKYNKGPLRPSN